MKKGFTLVELLVVIGILGILSGVLITSLGGVGENAKTVKCASNMKSLASAVNSASVAGGYPFAQSALYFQVSGGSSLGVNYGVHKGWISGIDRNVSYPVSSEFSITPAHYDDSADDVQYAVTNGAIWNVVGKTRDVYICPAHLDASRKARTALPVAFSMTTLSVPEELSLRLSPIRRMPYRNMARPPKRLKML